MGFLIQDAICNLSDVICNLQDVRCNLHLLIVIYLVIYFFQRITEKRIGILNLVNYNAATHALIPSNVFCNPCPTNESDLQMHRGGQKRTVCNATKCHNSHKVVENLHFIPKFNIFGSEHRTCGCSIPAGGITLTWNF